MSKRFTDAEIFCRGHQSGVCDAQKILIAARQFLKKPMSNADLLQWIDVQLDKLRDFSINE